jgi:hypothetical protein
MKTPWTHTAYLSLTAALVVCGAWALQTPAVGPARAEAQQKKPLNELYPDIDNVESVGVLKRLDRLEEAFSTREVHKTLKAGSHPETVGDQKWIPFKNKTRNGQGKEVEEALVISFEGKDKKALILFDASGIFRVLLNEAAELHFRVYIKREGSEELLHVKESILRPGSGTPFLSLSLHTIFKFAKDKMYSIGVEWRATNKGKYMALIRNGEAMLSVIELPNR